MRKFNFLSYTFAFCLVAYCGFFTVWGLSRPPAAHGDEGPVATTIILEAFYDGDCPDCTAIRNETLIDARLAFPELEVREYDIRTPDGLQKLLDRRQTLDISETYPVVVILNGRVYLGGRAAITERLFGCLTEMLADPNARSVDFAEEAISTGPKESAQTFVNRLGIPVIILAGLADGMNPCAFAVIILLAGLLLAHGSRPAAWGIIGSLFCAGVFIAYLILGFGVLRLFTRLTAWRLAGDLIRQVAAGGLILMAIMSFRDAWIFKRTGRAEKMQMQLPERLNSLARRLTRWTVITPRRGIAIFGVGALVTLLEAPCTGQIYGPVLFYLSLRSTDITVWGLLILYNLMFVLPHALVFILAAHRRASGILLAQWSRNNVARAKVFMGIIMLILAILLIKRIDFLAFKII